MGWFQLLEVSSFGESIWESFSLGTNKISFLPEDGDGIEMVPINGIHAEIRWDRDLFSELKK